MSLGSDFKSLVFKATQQYPRYKNLGISEEDGTSGCAS